MQQIHQVQPKDREMFSLFHRAVKERGMRQCVDLQSHDRKLTIYNEIKMG